MNRWQTTREAISHKWRPKREIQEQKQVQSKLLIDNTKSLKHLGATYRSKEETFHDVIAQFLELESQGL